MTRPDPLAVIADYHARAVASGNAWAQTLARKVTYDLTPGAPNERNSMDKPERAPERLEGWVPRVGGEALHQGWGQAAKRVEILELDGRFTKVREVVAFMGGEVGGEVAWVLTVDLHPVGERT